MLVLTLLAVLIATDPTPSSPPSAQGEVEPITVTAHRPDPDAPRPVPIKHVSIAPQGDRLAFVTEHADGERVVVQSLDGQVLKGIDTAPRTVRGTEWGGAHHIVMRVSRGEGAPPEAVAFDLRDRSFGVFFSRTPSTANSPFQPALRGRPNEAMVKALLSEPITGSLAEEPVSFVKGRTLTGKDVRYDLYRVDLDTGLSRVHAEGGPATDQFVVAPRGHVLARADFDRRSGRWRLLARRGPGWRPVLTRHEQTEPPRVLGLGRDGASVLVRVADETGPRLVEVSMDGDIGTPLGAGRPHSRALFDRSDGRLIALDYQKPEPEFVIFEPRLNRAWPNVLHAFEGQTVRLESWTPDYAKLVLLAEGPADSAAYYLVDLVANTAWRLRPAIQDRSDVEGPAPS